MAAAAGSPVSGKGFVEKNLFPDFDQGWFRGGSPISTRVGSGVGFGGILQAASESVNRIIVNMIVLFRRTDKDLLAAQIIPVLPS
jgi:hypothetical protein